MVLIAVSVGLTLFIFLVFSRLQVSRLETEIRRLQNELRSLETSLDLYKVMCTSRPPAKPEKYLD